MIDLHLHTTASDGLLAPKELIDKCMEAQLKAIAITDHDSVDSLDEALAYADETELAVIPAIELSSDLDGRDVHILGYYIDYNDKSFLAHLRFLREARKDRAIKMIAALRREGIDITLEDLSSVVSNNSSWGRAHISRVMVAKGFVSTIQEAFDKYIGRGGPCYVEKYIFSPTEVISLILRLGGIPVLAHPAITKVDQYIKCFIDAGLAGIEIYHSEHLPQDVDKYRNIAKKLGLLMTGGSDFHGEPNKFQLGTIKVPDDLFEALKSAKIKT